MKQSILLSLLFLLTATFSALAQNAPQGVNYQCIVRNNQTGDPITNQTVTLLFSIRSGSPNGLVDYQEKQVGSTNEFGLVNLIIGRGQAQVNTFNSINWGAGSKFLTVLLESSPNVFDEIGNSELLSVPYALYAQNGGGGGGSDNWGTQTAFTNNGLTGNGLANNPIGLAQQGAQSGQVLKWNGTAWVPGDDIQGTGTGGGTVTQINTGAGLQGGPIMTTGTISLSNTGVQAGIHGSATEIPVITVDAQGRITNVTKVIVQPGAVGLNSGTGINVVTNGFNNFTINNTGDTNAADDLTTATQANGDVSGPFSNLQIKANAVTGAEIADNAVGGTEITDGSVTSAELAANAVTTVKIADGAVATAKLANQSVTGEKIDDMSAASGQVLKWNGAAWAPAADATGNFTLTAGAGIGVNANGSNFTISNTGDADGTDDLTNTTAFNGDVAGTFNNLQLKPSVVVNADMAANSIGTNNLINGAVTAAKLNNMGAANGQVLQYNGMAWAPVNLPAVQGDNWGTQIVQTTPTLSGIGTNANPLTIAQQGAANGQVLRWNGNTWLPATLSVGPALSGNGTAATPFNLAQQGAANGQVLQWNNTGWVPANLPAAAGDDWGAQTAVVGAALTGNGTAANPLNLAKQNANTGEVLKWNGNAWLPAADNSSGTGDTYSAGPGISVTGASPNFIINNLGDDDSDPANELQTITLVGNQLTLSDGGGTVALPGGGNNYAEGAGIDITGVAPNFTIVNTGDLSNNNELQNLAIAGNVLSITNGNAVNLPVGPVYTAGAGINLAGNVITNTGDLNNTNELQELKLTGPILEITNGNTVDLSPLLGGGGDNWTQQGANIFNANAGNVLIGTNVSTSGKFEVFNADPSNEAGRFVQKGGTQNAIFAQSNAGAGGFFTSDSGPAILTGTGNVGIGAAIPAARLHIVGNGESVRLQGATPTITFLPGAANTGGYARLVNGMLALGTVDLNNVGLTPGGRNSVIANGNNGFVGIGEANATDAMLRVAQKNGGILLHNVSNDNFWEFSANPVDGSLQFYNSTFGPGVPACSFTAAGLFVPSDRRLKTDIEAISSSVLSKMMQLKPVSYRYKAETVDAQHSLGFLAQDVQAIFPELVAQSMDRKGKKDFLTVNYSGFGVLAIKAIQEQQTEIETLKKENEALRSKTESLEARLLRLEQLMGNK